MASVRRARAIMAALLLAACSRGSPSSQRAEASASETLANGIVFIRDNYASALALARAKKRPLFVDVWAPWCHTCMSMRQYVFPDGNLGRFAGELVWATIDLERAENAEFLARFPTTTLPTLWVIDPASQSPALKWIGSATAGAFGTARRRGRRGSARQSRGRGGSRLRTRQPGHRRRKAGRSD